MVHGGDRVDLTDELSARLRRLTQHRATNIGFPAAADFDYSELAPFLAFLLNNLGDPYIAGAWPAHTKDLEIEVVDFLADLFDAPHDDRWGYVASGGTEAVLFALRMARSVYPRGIVYFCESAHIAIPKSADILGLPALTIRATGSGEMDYDDLRYALGQHRDQPAIIVANIGTTMTEAVDDVGHIKRVLRSLAIHEHYIHADAALAGIPLAVDEEPAAWTLAPGGANSVCVSGHKFIGSPIPYGVVVTRRSLVERTRRGGAYTASPDTTISGSRAGHAPLFLWYALHHIGWRDGLRSRAERCRELANYAVRRLSDIGWEAWRNPRAFTVMLRTPPAEITNKWTLATHDGISHLICMPGITQDHIDRFVDDLAPFAKSRERPTADVTSVPRVRSAAPARV